MAPGPITAVTVGKGTESPHAGALIAIGHGLVEIPLMALISLGLGSALEVPYVRSSIALVGGLFLLYMAVDMFRGVNRVEVSSRGDTRSPIVAGIALSLGNPYFFLWWVTVGAALILRSVRFGLVGFLAFALGHWLCDFCWDYFLSIMSFRGGKFFGRTFQKVVFAVCGVFLAFFGAKLLFEVVSTVLA
jgi:threonine/homoserine/homoserine lactone efflux protein